MIFSDVPAPQIGSTPANGSSAGWCGCWPRRGQFRHDGVRRPTERSPGYHTRYDTCRSCSSSLQTRLNLAPVARRGRGNRMFSPLRHLAANHDASCGGCGERLARAAMDRPVGDITPPAPDFDPPAIPAATRPTIIAEAGRLACAVRARASPLPRPGRLAIGMSAPRCRDLYFAQVVEQLYRLFHRKKAIRIGRNYSSRGSSRRRCFQRQWCRCPDALPAGAVQVQLAAAGWRSPCAPGPRLASRPGSTDRPSAERLAHGIVKCKSPRNLSRCCASGAPSAFNSA